MPLSEEQKAFILKAHYRSATRNEDGTWSYSIQSCRQQFEEEFPDVHLPYKTFVQEKQRIVSHFDAFNCVCKKKSTGRPKVLTEDTVNDLQQRIEQSPTKSLRKLNAQSDCIVANDENGVSYYKCDTLRDLERNGNPDSLNVTISNGKLVSPLSSLKPGFSVSLSDNVGFTNEIFGYIKDLSNLWDRRLEWNTLTSSTFGSLPIKILRLDHGHIMNIQQGAFSRMTQLMEIHIVKNDLQTVTAGVFNYLNIDTLALSNNKIRIIEGGAFSNMQNLKHLYLDGNLISNFQSSVLMNYKNQLETLHLQSNSIKIIDRNTLKGFDNLRELNLSNNKIDKIVNYSFEELLNLEILSLANNFLRDLNEEIFPIVPFPYLLKLNVADNRLSYLTMSVLDKLTSLKYISIAGNPWQCSCLNSVIKWIGDHHINHVCDGEYLKGLRPICVVGNSDKCFYNNNNQNVQEYQAANDFGRIDSCFI
ncbi:hypothetical protein FQR65_LT10416 [Abscondita terminalis]|nr:hypothetical protein FQR65_LT10416 [Abscondita terminalis]